MSYGFHVAESNPRGLAADIDLTKEQYLLLRAARTPEALRQATRAALAEAGYEPVLPLYASLVETKVIETRPGHTAEELEEEMRGQPLADVRDQFGLVVAGVLHELLGEAA